ncbi:MOSC domain-containing protein [Chondromyces apiculatus]|uniref:Flavodoxin reductases (Ferredoxin-NADPH reductases) family 1 n=1 Tax=Chondromyces apiculatus DSM 436 TaxID=1192034 RepID=A0A017T9C6_9BACT|nr:MOSC N-terminal beta barrel domain-containing protein [Chondromyces apiculatus]EYF05522.1 Flavodoxin reductases (ferredoxin-NADPH reductases) family 1 [Chondromyces apiculatus DSM 436]
MSEIRVSSLHVYPVKSARGLTVTEAEVEARGFAHDRRFMVVDERGAFFTQRELPAMALIGVAIQGETLVLTVPGLGHAEVPLRPQEGGARRVRVWDDECEAVAVSPEAADLLGRHLGRRCELVYMPESSLRPVRDGREEPGDLVSFADAFPFLIVSRASLEGLNARLAEREQGAVPMDRFRPNLVVEGCDPHAEDGWSEIAIGAVRFQVTKPCARCALVTVDQERGVAGKEPLATLATYRKDQGQVLFGQNMVPTGRGVIRVGDPVRPVSP